MFPNWPHWYVAQFLGAKISSRIPKNMGNVKKLTSDLHPSQPVHCSTQPSQAFTSSICSFHADASAGTSGVPSTLAFGLVLNLVSHSISTSRPIRKMVLHIARPGLHLLLLRSASRFGSTPRLPKGYTESGNDRGPTELPVNLSKTSGAKTRPCQVRRGIRRKEA